MSAAPRPLRAPRASSATDRAQRLRATQLAALVALLAMLGWLAATQADLYRPLLALGLISLLGVAVLRWPRAAIVMTILFLPALGLIRRLLIETSGWPEADPLLLVGPALALILCVKAYVIDSRPLGNDLLGKLLLVLLALVVFGLVMPIAKGQDQAALASIVFTAAPLLWFFVGRTLPDRRTIAVIQMATAILAAPIAIYGLLQTEVGFPPWDRAWIDVGGYVALNVGEQIRGFASFASATEYGYYLGVGAVLALVAASHGRVWAIPLLPLLAAGILMSSVRSVLVLTLVALIVVIGMRSNRPRIALPMLAVGGLIILFAAAPILEAASRASGSDLVAHQLEGIARPLDEDASTLPAHFELFRDGITDGFRHPLGQGTPATTLAGETFGRGAGTELDLSNAFVSFGLVGGLVFLAIIATALALIARRYLESRDLLLLGVLGIGIATLGMWLNGAHYAVTPLLWLMVGWATRPESNPGR